MEIKLDELRISLGATLQANMHNIVSTYNNVQSNKSHTNPYLHLQGEAQEQCLVWMFTTYNTLIECIVVDSLDETKYALYKKVEAIKEVYGVK